MSRRLELHEVLCKILGSRNVYFQPPASIKMQYPAIIYARRKPLNLHADDSVYNNFKCYELTIIDKDPDSDIPDKISELPLCSFDRHFTSDNLNHDTFTLYY